MKLLCMKGESLNTVVYRGFAKAQDLAKISDQMFSIKKIIDKGRREILNLGMQDKHMLMGQVV